MFKVYFDFIDKVVPLVEVLAFVKLYQTKSVFVKRKFQT